MNERFTLLFSFDVDIFEYSFVIMHNNCITPHLISYKLVDKTNKEISMQLLRKSNSKLRNRAKSSIFLLSK